MRVKVIDISQKINRDLKSRVLVRKLYDEMIDLEIKKILFDFKNVNSASRSFMDEFYNVFYINSIIDTKIKNLSPDLERLFEVVRSTQKRSKSKHVKTKSDKSVVQFTSISELMEYLNHLSST